jgi:uncharacterized phage-associated protein
MPLYGYNVRKAAQVTAYFAIQAGGSINVLKLAKLLYLADRRCLEKYDFPMLFDTYVSMDHGPVTSSTLNYVSGTLEDGENWDTFVADRAGNEVGIARGDLSVDDLDELSDAELNILDETWGRLGHLQKYAIRDFTHDNCPEWEDPHGTSIPIPYERVLKFLGKRSKSELIAEEIKAQRSVARSLSLAK